MSRHLFALSIALLSACSSTPQTAPEAATEAATAAPASEHQHGDVVNAPAQPAVPPGAKVFFEGLEDGAKVSSPLVVKMGAEGMKVAPAGAVVEGEGHHHILIDDAAGVATGVSVPKDDTHIHYGDGSTETTLELSPGEHTLTLQMGDGIHRSYGEPLRATIHVTVE